MTTRRDFIKASGAIAAASSLAMSSRSYSNILGANDRVNIALMGARSRGKALLDGFFTTPNCAITHVCDVDKRVLAQASKLLIDSNRRKPVLQEDIRETLEDKNIDALAIATPDHWHAPAAIMALQAGKHVYVEKPCGHNPAEGEMLVAAQQKYNKVVQMGNQQRSSNETAQLIKMLHGGHLGEVYKVYTWYANNRKSIGNGQKVAPQDWLNWDLWQGPAPRKDYYSNYVHYNWHWFWHWGTAETCNNAAHELDIARWAIQGEFPEKVAVDASRQFFKSDDWQMYDTMNAEFTFANNKKIVWDGHSCNRVLKWGRGRGLVIYATKGYVILDRTGYEIYDLDNNLVSESKIKQSNDSGDLMGGGILTRMHVNNFISTLRGETKHQASPIDEGHKSTLMCHLANMAYRSNETLICDPANGKPKSKSALLHWQRDYAPGWAPKI
ncbi:Gfo/Idh/MocA family protein [Paraglaciecola marina]|uniref:Gfo/Idh/MocA family protein n=1 Tax=Paraglaciecola marina TaxID=2500157 RepID=UPI00105C4BB4|nr:Gfo/Idh/MocA family oxidoreductase [Paraglaciecola marina]